MDAADSQKSPDAGFAEEFGRLVALARTRPDDLEAHEGALRSVLAELKQGPCRLEAGFESSDFEDDLSLKSRLLARRVDTVRVSPAAPASELLDLARALASDTDPIPSTSLTQVDLVPGLEDLVGRGSSEQAFSIDPVMTPRRSRTMAGPVTEMEGLGRAMREGASLGKWTEALHAAQALCRLAERFPEHERKTYVLNLRRTFSRRLLDQFIQFALRVPEERVRAVEVLHFAGPEAAELLCEHVAAAETLGPRAFLFEALAEMPEAHQMVLALLSRPEWYAVAHGVELLERMHRPESVGPLKAALVHADERVRAAAALALGVHRDASVPMVLRRSLTDPSARVRVAAAHGLARQQSGGLAMPILAALETEKDAEVWRGMVGALAEIDTSEAATALAVLALERQTILRRGRPMPQRLAVVKALAGSPAGHARHALERLAREGDAPIKNAAVQALRKTDER